LSGLFGLSTGKKQEKRPGTGCPYGKKGQRGRILQVTGLRREKQLSFSYEKRGSKMTETAIREVSLRGRETGPLLGGDGRWEKRTNISFGKGAHR